MNYNVKYFLEQCLCSVERAVAGLEAEVIVADNRSSDGSLDYLKPRFPWVRFLALPRNAGFASACNAGLQQSTGRYILFLNPDTLVAEDSFTKAIDFLQAQPRGGALGVRMVDGTGRFLRESKRSFPGPLTSFYKLSGLARLFPRSPVFARYHLGHMREEESGEVDVLSGAFLLVKRAVLDEVGSFDESFFMYGEDVDLSFRIQKAGYRNFYFAGTTIIHFKGESTRKGSLNYVRLFYQAMSQFVHKHYGGTRASLFTASIELAIWLRAAVTAAAHFIRRAGLPLFDLILVLLSFWLVKEVWETWVRPDVVYSPRLLLLSLPLYSLFYLGVAYYTGLYDRYYRRVGLLRATWVAAGVLLVVYALLPEHLRFSRGIILFGVITAYALLHGLRWLLIRGGVLPEPLSGGAEPYLLVAASEEEYRRMQPLFRRQSLADKLIGRVPVAAHETGGVARLEVLEEAAQALAARALVLCAGTLSYRDIIRQTGRLGAVLRLRYHASGSGSLVGSDSSGVAGLALSAESAFRLSRPAERRWKRLIDRAAALFFLLTFPLQLLLHPRPGGLLRNSLLVLAGRRTWVGYTHPEPSLPPLPPAVVAPHGVARSLDRSLSPQSAGLVDYRYAHDYEPLEDVRALRAGYRHLGDR